MHRQLLAALCATALWGALSGDAQAQVRRYQPSRPTVSPYMNLFRSNFGPLPNYYSLVRPQINQLSFNSQIAAQQVQQSASLSLLQSQAGQAAATPTGKSGWFMTFGRQTFMAAPTAGAAPARGGGAPVRFSGGRGR